MPHMGDMMDEAEIAGTILQQEAIIEAMTLLLPMLLEILIPEIPGTTERVDMVTEEPETAEDIPMEGGIVITTPSEMSEMIAMLLRLPLVEAITTMAQLLFQDQALMMAGIGMQGPPGEDLQEVGEEGAIRINMTTMHLPLNGLTLHHLMTALADHDIRHSLG